jgi:non-lysosomal glucosylceramidase
MKKKTFIIICENAIFFFKKKVRRLLGNGGTAARKVSGAVPHDLGSPCEEPWTKVNVYNFQDVSRWKDLGPKFVLTVLRDYEATKSKRFVAAVFPTVIYVYIYTYDTIEREIKNKCVRGVGYLFFFLSLSHSLLHNPPPPPHTRSMNEQVIEVMASVAKFDKDGDGLIENSGFPDQTYDIWSVNGPSAYTGGLWVASLAASLKLAEIAEEAAMISKDASKSEEVGMSAAASDGLIALAAAVKATYAPMFEKAKVAYEEKLWNGQYFNYDSSDGHNSDSVMSDQCAGLWYARACSLEPTVDPEKAARALRTVYQYNVTSYCEGRRGCVNGMKPASVKHPNGIVDNNSMQSREVWTGTTYAVAAAMLQEFGAEHDARQLKLKTPSPTSKLLYTPQPNKPTTPAAAAMKKTSDNDNNNHHQQPSLWDAAFGTIKGMWLSGWNELGYWYATPEGWEASGNYRSLGYMRPLSIWAMQYAIEKNDLISKHEKEKAAKAEGKPGAFF